MLCIVISLACLGLVLFTHAVKSDIASTAKSLGGSISEEIEALKENLGGVVDEITQEVKDSIESTTVSDLIKQKIKGRLDDIEAAVSDNAESWVAQAARLRDVITKNKEQAWNDIKNKVNNKV